MPSSGYAISRQRTATLDNTLQHTATQEICASADRRMRSSGYANSPPTPTLVTRPYIPDPELRYKLFASTLPVSLLLYYNPLVSLVLVCCSVLHCVAASKENRST